MAKPKPIIGRDRLRKLLKVSNKTLDALIESGLPQTEDGRFVRQDVIDWFNDEFSDPPDEIITNRARFAKAMNVSVSAVRYWEQDETFPGSANRYPMVACIKWHNERENQAGAPRKMRSESDDRLTNLRAKKLETEIKVKEGELVALDEVTDYMERSVARHREILRSFPDRIAKRFTERGFDNDAVNLCRREASIMIEDLQTQIHRDLVEHAEEDVATE